MPSRCTCAYDLTDTACPTHGLYDDVRYSPMNRHARKVVVMSPGWEIGDRCLVRWHEREETAEEVQRRLYEEARRV